MEEKIKWTSSLTGITLAFSVLPHNTNWNSIGGIYMFCRREINGSYTPVYIGQTENFRNRIPNHEQWLPSTRRGASIVLAAVEPNKKARDRAEEYLVYELQPELNDLLK